MMSQSELAAKVGVSRSTIASYENEISEPSIDVIKAIARATGKPVSYFIGDNESDLIFAQARQLITMLRSASISGATLIPILGHVPAGDWQSAEIPEAVDHISLDETLGKRAHFGLFVDGMSMSPTIVDGDLVLVQQGRLPANRDIVVVRNEHGEVTLKRYIKTREKVFLKPDNPAYGEPSSEVGFIIGVVIGVVRYLGGRLK